MSSDFPIELSDVGKSYKIYHRPIDRIREMYSLRRRTYHANFQALADINLAISKGQTVGIIGPNGSGKSTLLEIICGTLTPTRGIRKVQGRIAALLELGAGFNPAFSGRENVYLNASLIGISKEEIDSRFDQIVEFSGISDFIEHPVSTYSSGMYVRLAFAVAINTDPDILIVDEALAVGDIRFQRKCYRRFAELQRAGKTILFVTHSVDLVQAHCSNAIYLKNGRIASEGDPKHVIQEYLEDMFGPQSKDERNLATVSEKSTPNPDRDNSFELDSQSVDDNKPDVEWRQRAKDDLSIPRDRFAERQNYNAAEYRWGDQKAFFYDYKLEDDAGSSKSFFSTGDQIRLAAKVFFTTPLEGLIFGFTIKTVDGQVVFGSNSRSREMGFFGGTLGQTLVVNFDFVCSLVSGEYFISIGIAADDDDRDNVAIDRRYDVICLPVVGHSGDFGISDVSFNLHIDPEINF
ncbi:ABC transporter ATP-binding protein [Arenicellales bacterium IMCC56312]